ncbi:hypothetical protein BGW38_009467, partial [Lunasporangiospora selenospora]
TSNEFLQWTVGDFFSSIGNTGYSCLQSVIIADMTPLKYRGLALSFVDLGHVINIWIGQAIFSQFETPETWRNGFIMCTCAVVVGAILVCIPVWHLQRKGEKSLGERPRRTIGWLWRQFDFIGAIILTATLSLLFFPLLTAQTYTGNFKHPVIITCLCLGGVCLIGFLIWTKLSPKLNVKPMLPKRIWSDRTVMGAICGSIVSNIMVSMNYTYFYQYLVITR